MSCENCKNEKEAVTGAAKESRLMADMVQAYDRQNKRLWACLMALCVAFVIFAGCVVWAFQNVQSVANEAVLNALQNAQSVANEAVLNALETVAEMEVTTETVTTTQTVEGDSATINNVDGEQYNDEATNNGGGS